MGYLPRDLLMSDGFVQRGCQMLSCLASELKDAPPVLVGAATRTQPISDDHCTIAPSC